MYFSSRLKSGGGGDFEAALGGRNGKFERSRTQRRLERTDRRHRVVEDLLRETDALLGAEMLAVRRFVFVVVGQGARLAVHVGNGRLVAGEVGQSGAGVEYGGVREGDGPRHSGRRWSLW